MVVAVRAAVRNENTHTRCTRTRNRTCERIARACLANRARANSQRTSNRRVWHGWLAADRASALSHTRTPRRYDNGCCRTNWTQPPPPLDRLAVAPHKRELIQPPQQQRQTDLRATSTHSIAHTQKIRYGTETNRTVPHRQHTAYDNGTLGNNIC